MPSTALINLTFGEGRRDRVLSTPQQQNSFDPRRMRNNGPQAFESPRQYRQPPGSRGVEGGSVRNTRMRNSPPSQSDDAQPQPQPGFKLLTRPKEPEQKNQPPASSPAAAV